MKIFFTALTIFLSTVCIAEDLVITTSDFNKGMAKYLKIIPQCKP